MGSYRPISSIAIVGAGPIGLCCAKYLLAENAFETIDIYEQRDRVGGVWNLSPATWSRDIPIPQTNPRFGQNHDRNIVNGSPKIANGPLSTDTIEFESPLYDYLETNIPKSLMAYSDKPFPKDEPLFPSHQAVLHYLEDYAEDVSHLIHFHCRVLDVRLDQPAKSDRDVWRLEHADLRTGNQHTNLYDAVIVANGHYTVPYVPDIKGAKEWNQSYAGCMIHSKAYRKPEHFTGKKVLVIGNSASGLDIAAQIGEHCQKPLLLSSRSVSAFGSMPATNWRKDVEEIIEFMPPHRWERAIRLSNGQIVENIDAVVFATGYFYSFPFLSNVQPPVITDGFRSKGVFEHIFHIEHPSLVFPVINLKVIPFPLAQNQAAVISRVWSGRLSLPSKAEMEAWERSIIEKQGDGKYFHLQKFPEDAAQINQLYDWAAEARKIAGLENDGHGKTGTRWNERQVWMRSQFPQIKASYTRRKEQRYKVHSIEQLGFDFDKWREAASSTDLEMFTLARC